MSASAIVTGLPLEASAALGFSLEAVVASAASVEPQDTVGLRLFLATDAGCLRRTADVHGVLRGRDLFLLGPLATSMALGSAPAVTLLSGWSYASVKVPPTANPDVGVVVIPAG